MVSFGTWWHVLGLLLILIPGLVRESDGLFVVLSREVNDAAEHFDTSPWIVVLCGSFALLSWLSLMLQPPSQTPFPWLVSLSKWVFGLMLWLYRLLAIFYQLIIVFLLAVAVVVTVSSVFAAFVTDHSSADSSANEPRQSA